MEIISRQRAAARFTRRRRAQSRPHSSRPTAGNTSIQAPQHPHFGKVLSSLITEQQGQRIQSALAMLQ